MTEPMPRGDQLYRQWRLRQMIDRPQGVTVDDAARELSCTIRTIWRDLDALDKTGLPLYPDRAANGNRSVWRLDEAFKQRLPLKLTLGELQAPAADHLPKIHQALAERRTLKARYHSASRDSVDERRIDPYHLTLHNGGLYLVAHCHLRDAPWIFAVERMRTVELTSRRFDVPASFDAEEYLAGVEGCCVATSSGCALSSRGRWCPPSANGSGTPRRRCATCRMGGWR
jgi:predicted DNA-binding transcriptional regulator YafY